MISTAFAAWEREAQERFDALKTNEEELNRIFIDIYGLQDELTPEVEDKDVTVRRADISREIRSLISYAVGCMFGRYSLDVEGLVFAGGNHPARYAGTPPREGNDCAPNRTQEEEPPRPLRGHPSTGGELDMSKYATFIPDPDNILPICDDEYFDDDIVGRFVDFVRVVYGADTLEENLKFIADALFPSRGGVARSAGVVFSPGDAVAEQAGSFPSRGGVARSAGVVGSGTSREIIRKYFLNDFYKDHCKIYQKRPIYWLFDSGKKNGFKGLVYLHRYSRDLLAKLRTDYVHEQQERYRTQLGHIAAALATASGSERAKLIKLQDKLTEQAKELASYEEKVHHLADQHIRIDLDDGVKHNYAIFADVLAKI